VRRERLGYTDAVRLEDFDYVLPPSAVAQTPAPERDAARLLVIDRARSALADHVFGDLPRLLRPGDCVVVNDSRVLPARVLGRDAGGRAVEVLFVEAVTVTRWRALVRPGRRFRRGALVHAGDARLRVADVLPDGLRELERLDGTIDDLMADRGQPPLPPYIGHFATPGPGDRERYQTVYADPPGSVAAPTAGLHFTSRMLATLRAGGVEVHALTLHVGPGTFRPIKTDDVRDHVLAPERVTIPPAVADAVNAARREGRRVVAVGTTTTRALEGAAIGGRLEPRTGAVDLYITPGHRFQVVDALVTNFHLPRSSLLVLVAAFAGRELILKAYTHAVHAGYRFYSYGDATLIV
jgi:S-adenosylmethionine:tRNA ribosyltransferase-isomerase